MSKYVIASNSVLGNGKQQGATLAVALIMLFLLTILGVSTVKMTISEEKMAQNIQDKVAAFQAAETALLSAENWLMAQVGQPPVVLSCTVMPCVNSYSNNFFPEDKTAGWWTSNSMSYSGALAGIATSPRHYIEYARFVQDSPMVGQGLPQGVHYYRVSVRGTGFSNLSASVLQSTVARKY